MTNVFVVRLGERFAVAIKRIIVVVQGLSSAATGSAGFLHAEYQSLLHCTYES